MLRCSDNFKKILDSGNFRYVGLHGWGEPMLNKQLFEMINYAESRGVFTNLTANGTLIQKNIDKIFSSGLREIAFGAYDRKLFLQSFPQIEELIIEKIRRESEIPRTYLDITIYRESLPQIPDLLKLARALHVDGIILHRLFNAYKIDPAIEYISAREEKGLFAGISLLARVSKLALYLPQKHSLPCRVVRSSIFVTAEGRVTPCCFLPDLYIGNALEQGVRGVVHSKVYADFVKNMKKHPICSVCKW